MAAERGGWGVGRRPAPRPRRAAGGAGREARPEGEEGPRGGVGAPAEAGRAPGDGAEVDVERRAGQHPEPRRGDVLLERDAGEAIAVVEPGEGEYGREPGEQHDAPAGAADGLVDGFKARVALHPGLDPPAREIAAPPEGEGRPERRRD